MGMKPIKFWNKYGEALIYIDCPQAHNPAFQKAYLKKRETTRK
jgi:hypothetical protein